MNKFVKPEVLNEYIEQICEKYHLPDSFKSAMMSQVHKMKQIYGEQIPRDDFLQVFGQQQQALKTGYRKPPVDIEEFLLSKEYLNVSGTIRPKIKGILVDIFNDYSHCYEVVLSGSLRYGKTYCACCAFAYHIYKLSCLYNPQAHYELAPGSEIVFMMQSLKEDKAKRNFREFKGMIDASEYFKQHFPQRGKSLNYSVFPGNIRVKPAPSTSTAGISENVLCAFIDEANFMKVVKGSPNKGEDEQYYDQATKIYRTIKDRIENQFKNFATGEWPGKIYLSSSANHTGDFIQTKKEEAQTAEHIYVADYALWEVKDINKSGKKFWVQLPDENQAGQILIKKPYPMGDDIIEVPIELKDQFEANLHDAIRNVAGVPISRESKFIPSSAVTENVLKYEQYYGDEQIFTKQEVDINSLINVESLLNIPFIRTINTFGIFHSHLDMAVTHDAAGLSVGAAMGSKVIETRNVFDPDQGKYFQEPSYTSPIYVMFGLLRIIPPKYGQINIESVWKLYFALKEYLTNLNSWTADYAYSTTISQILKKAGIKTDQQSVDKKPDPAVETKTSLMEHRLWVPEHETFKEEVKHLQQDATTGKVDHTHLSTKDVFDAVAGATYRLSKRKSSFKKQGNPPTLKEMYKVAMAEEQKEKQEKKTKRPSSGNRSQGWQKRR